MPAVATTGLVGMPHRRTYQAGAANIARGLALVQGATDAQLVVASAANAQAFAVVEDATVNIGDPLSAILDREATGIAGAAIAAGQGVITDANGRFVPSLNAGDNVVGRALSSAALAGDEFVIFVSPFIR